MVAKDNAPLSKANVAQRIFEDIRSHIENKQLEPGAKLQSETALAQLYSAKTYQIRQALQLLKKAELIYSVPKVGAFVAEAGNGGSGDTRPGFYDSGDPLPASGNHLPHAPLTLTTGSNSALQQQSWNEILRELKQHNCFLDITMDYSNRISGPTPPPDVRECSAPLVSYQAGDMPLLNIRDFFLDSNNAGLVFLDDYAVPSCYSTNLLFYNRRLLGKYGFAPPAYRDCGGQTEYLDYHLAAVTGNPQCSAPGSTQQPVTRLGHYLEMIFRALSGCRSLSESKFMEIFSGPCEQLVYLRRKYRMSPPQQAMRYLNDFLSGQTPFFLGNSSDIQFLMSSLRSDEFDCYPFFSVDGSCCRLALPLVICAETRHPIECIRLVQFLQQDFAQRKFAEFGFLPVREELTPMRLQKLPARTCKYETIFFRSPEEHYIEMNILNVELWDCILHGKSVADALNNCRAFAKAYLNMKLDKSKVAERKKWMELYS